MENEKDEHNISRSRDAQVDLFTLIGGSWPPALSEPDNSVYNYRSVPTRRHTMQRSSNEHTQRIKSVNLIEHIVPDRRRTKPSGASVHFEDTNTKMVHEPNKIDTGVLVDVCGDGSQSVHSSSLGSPHISSSRPSPTSRSQDNTGRGGTSTDQNQYGDVRWIDVSSNENAEEFYDSPVLGSPRVVPPSQKSSPVPLGNIQDEIGVGSLVEVATDVDQHHYGVVRWIGIVDETPTAGVELEQSVSGLGDGSRGGSRLFACAPGRALFVPLPLCRRDARFRDTPPPGAPPDREDSYQQPDCPVVPGVIPPLSSIGELAGKNRGIQGHHNSCYLDATLFAMFTFTSVFDALLYRPPEPEDSPHYSEVQRVLREQIVNPLRRHGYVRADRVMKLRTLLERLSDVPGLTSEEKDPEEFLNGLVAQILRAEPFLKLSSGQESFCYQLFVEKDEHISLPTVQQLLEQSFATSGVKLSEVPSTLIIQMPRFGKQYKLYQQVLPSPLLDVTDLIEGLPRQCAVCGALARWECGACAAPDGGVLEAGAFCAPCLRVVHNSRPQHKPTALSVPEDYISIMETCTLPRVYMELFAVLCIETSHYVAFVKAGAGIDAPWCFFDSMADRKGERNGYNIPEIVGIDSLGAWLGEECERAAQRDGAHAPSTRPRPLHARRLLSDAYMCFYRSPDVAMYR